MNLYNLKINNLEKIIGVLERRIEFMHSRNNRFSFYRLLIFAVGTTLTITGFISDNIAGWILLIISVAVFSITVHRHNMLLMGIKRFRHYLKLKQEQLARMKIDWEKIPEPVTNLQPGEISTLKDLDLTGNRSLHHLTDVSVSIEGSLLLKKKISELSPDFEKILESQKIIKELAEETRFRDKFLLKAGLISKNHLNCIKIVNWINKTLPEQDEKIASWIFPVSIILIASYMTLFVLNIYEVTAIPWLPVFLLYFILYSSISKKMGTVIEEAAGLEGQINKFATLIFAINSFSFHRSPNVKKFLKESFSGISGSDNAVEILKNLQKITSAMLLRENPVLRILLNVIFPYDLYYCRKLIKLKPELVKDIPYWLDKLNELECYVSLSGFASLNPDYTFPDLNKDSEHVFETKRIGHPLIKRDEKIRNNFSLKKENEILIITGSNMSGKSTFLKTLGINLCLAYAGAPVNADMFRTSLFELFTCIKVNDSVADGISYFYAEVKRLKELLDEFENDKKLPVFFLIDEIFKGTNNKERLAGSRAFIKRLAELKGTGAVTTHDLELVHLADEIPAITNYHFREEIENNKMKFDYIIHDGPCPTTNALRIMELSGLPVK